MTRSQIMLALPKRPTKAKKRAPVVTFDGPVGPPSIRRGQEANNEENSSTGPLDWWFVEVIGTPEPEPRGRATIARTKDGRVPLGAKPRIYVPSTAKAWKLAIRAAVEDELNGAGEILPSPAAWRLAFSFRFARPKNHYGTGRNAGKLKAWAVDLEHTSTPDLDNLIKAVKDALGDWKKKKLPLVWCDDSQVSRYYGAPVKRYVLPGEEPGLFLVVERIR